MVVLLATTRCKPGGGRLFGQWRPYISVQLCLWYSYTGVFQVSGTLSMTAMESFIQKQEKLLEALPSRGPEGKGGRKAKESSMQDDKDGMGTLEQGQHPDTGSGEFSPSVSALHIPCNDCSGLCYS